MAASNCGQILQEREDPFDLKVSRLLMSERVDLSRLLGGKL